MSVCVPARRQGGGLWGERGGRGEEFQSVPCVYRETCSRFKGVACVFHTGTKSTLGREVNWKSMGASVDRSDLGRWAMVCRGLAVRQAGKHASKRRLPGLCDLISLETTQMNEWRITHTFSTRGEDISCRDGRKLKSQKAGVGVLPNQRPNSTFRSKVKSHKFCQRDRHVVCSKSKGRDGRQNTRHATHNNLMLRSCSALSRALGRPAFSTRVSLLRNIHARVPQPPLSLSHWSEPTGDGLVPIVVEQTVRAFVYVPLCTRSHSRLIPFLHAPRREGANAPMTYSLAFFESASSCFTDPSVPTHPSMLCPSLSAKKKLF